jgi:hypothetical protein
MATYNELFDLRSDDDLRNKLSVAVLIRAQEYLDLPVPSANQVQWASKALIDPIAQAEKLINYVLAVNKNLTVQQIESATDSAIQNNASKAIDVMVDNGVI